MGTRGKLLGLFVKPFFIAAIEVNPGRIVAIGIVRKDRLKSLCRRPCLLRQFRPQSAIRAKDALFHAQTPHLLQYPRRRNLVGPEHDPVSPRLLNHLQLSREVLIAGQELLLDHHWVAETPRSIAKLYHSKAAVAAVHAEQGNTLQTKLAVNVPRQSQALYPVILQVSKIPRYVGLGDRGICRSRVDDRYLRLECHAQRDVRRVRTDGAEDRPVLI